MNSPKSSSIMKIGSVSFLRIPVRTRIITPEDRMSDIVREFALPYLKPGDILTISESPLAITQGRAVYVTDLKISLLARVLWKFVSKSPYGVGLRCVNSMQCAIDECGSWRIFVAACAGAFGKLLGKKGWFYIVAGRQAALIDADSTSPIPPYHLTVIKGPLNPEKEAQELFEKFGCPVAIMDINDIGGSWMIGASDGLSSQFMEKVMHDNPQGNEDELTPLCIVRRLYEKDLPPTDPNPVSE